MRRLSLSKFENHICSLGVHCAACRDSGADGKKWRKSLGDHFELPGNKTDFDCPAGVPWDASGDDLPEPSQPPPPTLVDRVQAACRECEEKTICFFGNQTDCSKRRVINDASQTWAVAKEKCKTGAIRQVLPAEPV